MPGSNGQPDNIAATVTEVTERLSTLVHDEIELAKAEMTAKATSLGRGAAAVAAGAVFGVFAIVFFLLTLALALNDLLVTGFGQVWLGFLIVLALLTLLMVAAFLFAWRKLKVGPPTPTMALDEAKKIRDTVSGEIVTDEPAALEAATRDAAARDAAARDAAARDAAARAAAATSPRTER